MAHWIIEDLGFGGTQYTCSECRETWNDLFTRKVSSITETCPNCGMSMNEDKIEYVEANKSRPKMKECNKDRIVKEIASLKKLHCVSRI